MKKRYNLMILVALAALSGCAGQSTVNSSTTNQTSTNTTQEGTSSMTTDNTNKEPTTELIEFYKNIGYMSLFGDSNFRNGFRVSKNITNGEGGPYHGDPLKHFDNDINPSWTLCQWGSNYDIYDKGYSKEVSADEKEITYISEGKNVNGNFVPAKKFGVNTETGAIYLESNTEVEYERPRNDGEPWVHLLFEQDFSNNLVQVASLDSLAMSATYEITKFEDKMNGQANTNRHAAQLVWYITLQNRNPESSSFGNYIWFGLNLWDNRSSGKSTPLYAAHDGGTSTFIYNPASSAYLMENDGNLPVPNRKVTARLEVLNVARTAFDLAKSRGYLGNTEYEDLYVGGMNFGFEIPGTYNFGVKFDSIGVFAKEK